MSDMARHEMLLELFRAAADSQPIPDGPHVVDDDELLTSWSLGLLSTSQHDRMLDHLAVCPRCRKELGELVREGIIELPEPPDLTQSPEPNSPVVVSEQKHAPAPSAVGAAPATAQRPYLLARLAGFALAVSLLIGLTLILLPRPGSENLLARARQALQTGDPAVAFASLEKLLAGQPDEELAGPAHKLLEEAGYALAKADLQEGRFKSVLDVEHRVARQGVDSARLLNLRSQAERGIPAEYTLAYAGTLLDYGYEPDGFAVTKSLPTVDQTSNRIDRSYQQSLTTHPDNVTLRINYGQFLLGQARYEEAIQQFRKAQQQAPKNVLVLLGLGLAHFELKEVSQALRCFQAAIETDRDNVAAHVNAAICLEKLGQPARAAEYWQVVKRMTNDAQLRVRVESWQNRQ